MSAAPLRSGLPSFADARGGDLDDDDAQEAVVVAPAPTSPTVSIAELLADADHEAETVIGWTRIAIALALLTSLAFSSEMMHHQALIDTTLSRGLRIGIVTTLMLALVGMVTVALVRFGLMRPWMAWLFVTVDAGVVGLSLHTGLEAAGLGGNFVGMLPTLLAAPVLLAVGALRYRPWIQVYFTALMIGTIVGVVLVNGISLERPPSLDSATRYLALPPNLARFTMIAATGLVTALVVMRARRHLEEAARRSLQQAALARFLPREVAEVFRAEEVERWRKGRRQIATIVFVDIRGSTALAENMDPLRLSVFINSFRRRVMHAAITHGGLIDKFVGDGALLVFGLDDPGPRSAAEALAFASDLHASIQRWNAKRAFNPPLRVGIGIHTGEVFVGVLGSEERLEFTVLGDSVNVAARLEQATKDLPADLIVSREALVAARVSMADWRRLGEICLRGRADPTELYASVSS